MVSIENFIFSYIFNHKVFYTIAYINIILAAGSKKYDTLAKNYDKQKFDPYFVPFLIDLAIVKFAFLDQSFFFFCLIVKIFCMLYFDWCV